MSHEFKFRNVGNGPLFLDMGGSTCKCTIGDLDKSVLKPGEVDDGQADLDAKSSGIRLQSICHDQDHGPSATDRSPVIGLRQGSGKYYV